MERKDGKTLIKVEKKAKKRDIEKILRELVPLCDDFGNKLETKSTNREPE